MRRTIKIISYALIAITICGIVVGSIVLKSFVFESQKLVSPNGELIVYNYHNAQEGNNVPYGNWIEIVPNYKFWHRPSFDNSVFAGYCNPTSMSVKWVSNSKIHITCLDAWDIVRQRNNYGEIQIEYDLEYHDKWEADRITKGSN